MYLRKQGFTLLEAIMGVAILSVGVFFILQAFSFSARVTGLSNDFVRAIFLAKDKIQELEFKERQDLIANEPAEAQDRTGKFAWGYTLVRDQDTRLYQMNFDVSWVRAHEEKRFSVRTLLR